VVVNILAEPGMVPEKIMDAVSTVRCQQIKGKFLCERILHSSNGGAIDGHWLKVVPVPGQVVDEPTEGIEMLSLAAVSLIRDVIRKDLDFARGGL
jgi:hypothetical protein